jgi:hypothetical protein
MAALVNYERKITEQKISRVPYLVFPYRVFGGKKPD